MYGSLIGNILAAAYFLYFQFTGLILIYLLLRREELLPRLPSADMAAHPLFLLGGFHLVGTYPGTGGHAAHPRLLLLQTL